MFSFPPVVADGAQGTAFHAGCVHVHEAAGRQTGRVQSDVAVRDISEPTASDRKTRRRQFRNGERKRPHQTNPLPPYQPPHKPPPPDRQTPRTHHTHGAGLLSERAKRDWNVR